MVEPAITPLPRKAADTPEPGGLLLMGTGLAALDVTSRMSFRRGLTKRPTLRGAAARPVDRLHGNGPVPRFVAMPLVGIDAGFDHTARGDMARRSSNHPLGQPWRAPIVSGVKW